MTHPTVRHALVLFLVLAVAFLRGRSASHKELLVSCAMALLGIPMAGAGAFLVLNGYADDSTRVQHETRVLDKHYSRSRHSTTYYVGLRSWRSGRGREEIWVSSDTYRHVRLGQSVMQVTTRAGRYGLEWVQDYRIVR